MSNDGDRELAIVMDSGRAAIVAIMQAGVVTARDVENLRRAVTAHGACSRDEAEALFVAVGLVNLGDLVGDLGSLFLVFAVDVDLDDAGVAVLLFLVLIVNSNATGVVVADHGRGSAGGPVGEFGEGGFGDDDGAGVAEVFNEGGVVGRDQVFKGEGAAGGGEAAGEDVVFEGDGDAVQQAQVLELRAKEIPLKKLQATLDAGYGIFAGSRPQWATLVFSATAARWVSQEEWHPQQRSQWLSDGCYQLEVPFTNQTELVMDVLRHSGEVRVVAPPSLAQAVMDQLRLGIGVQRGAKVKGLD